jgi:hypothetical protein
VKQATAHLKSAAALASKFCDVGATDAGLATLDELGAALESAKKALGAGGDVALVDEAVAWAKELRLLALDELASAPLDAPRSWSATQGEGAAWQTFRASRGTPAVHEAGDVPPVEVIARARPWDDPYGDERVLEEELDRERALSAEARASDLARIGRDTIEDIAILGGLRRLDDHEKWGDAAPFEERLLANLDLLWAFDAPAHDDVPKLGVPRALFRYVSEWNLPDWGRAFALAFGLGCSSSEAALRWVFLAMRRSSAFVMQAYREGLALGSNPAIDRSVFAELRSDAPAEMLAALLEVSARRRAFEASAIVPLLAHPSDAVKIAAVAALRNAPPELAVASATQVLATARDEVAVHAADELARRGRNEGVEHMRGVVASNAPLASRTLALRALALAGESKDEATMVALAKEREDGAFWLGFYGRASTVPVLLAELDAARTKGTWARRLTDCERAFRRVTGLDPMHDVAELAARIEKEGIMRRAPRLRAGEAYAPRAIVAELADLTTLQGERRALARELPVALPNAPVFDVEGFVASQAAAIAAIELR